MAEEWPSAWRDRVSIAVQRVTEGFEDRYGYPAWQHTIGPATSRNELATVANLEPPLTADLTTFYQAVGPVSLPDIANGYFLNPPDTLFSHTNGGGLPRLSSPVDVPLHVFGSDGDGALYAVPAGRPGPVYRLQESSMVADAFDASDAVVVAQDFRGFLDALEQAVLVFADSGEATDL